MDSLRFVEQAARLDVLPIYVLQGDDHFLKRQAIAALKSAVFGDAEDSLGLSTHAGDQAAFAAVREELDTLPFLAPRRLVVIDNADPFVTRYRAALEKYVAAPSATGVLVLDVKSWPANTRLAKLVDSSATIVCKAPAVQRLPEWCIRWEAQRHDKQLTAEAAHLLVDLIGPDMGQLDQELEKLATYAGSAKQINVGDVDKLVGNSRAETTWKIFGALGAGQPSSALTILDRLFVQGEDAMRIMGAFSMQLRRLAQAARLAQEGRPLRVALGEAGVPPFALQEAEQQLRRLGRERRDQLYDWLLEADLGLKGSSAGLPPRTQLERLLVRLAGKS